MQTFHNADLYINRKLHGLDSVPVFVVSRKNDVVLGFQGRRTDVPDGTDVTPEPFEKPYHVALLPVILRLIAVASHYLV